MMGLILLILAIPIYNTGSGILKRLKANWQDGLISEDFIRHIEKPRDNYKWKVERDGLTFHNLDGIDWSHSVIENYWNEKGSIEIS